MVGNKMSEVRALCRALAWHDSHSRCGSLCEKRACLVHRAGSTGRVATSRPLTVLSSWQTVHFALMTCSALTTALSPAGRDARVAKIRRTSSGLLLASELSPE